MITKKEEVLLKDIICGLNGKIKKDLVVISRKEINITKF